DPLADFFLFQQTAKQANKDHGGGELIVAAAFVKLLEQLRFRRLKSRTAHRSGRQAAAQLAATFEQELNLPAVVRRAVEGSVVYIVIRDRNTKARAELGQLIFIELLLLMSDVAAFAGFAETVAFDRGRQDDRGRAFVIDGRVIGRVNLFR